MKISLCFSIVSLILLSACASEQPADPLTAERNIAVARQVFVHFNDHNWKAMAALYADTAEFKDPSFGTGIVRQTREQTEKKYSDMESMFPDIRDDIVRVYPSGSHHVIVEFVSSATAPNGERWNLPICTIFEVRNGVIVKDYTYYDNQ
jgi:ketosteroid isomerase-like protein